MRIKREGNYAETAVRSTSTIAESNQNVLHASYIGTNGCLYFDPQVEVVGKKHKNKTKQ